MASLNEVHLIGNLTRDPETRTLPGGAVVARFGIAINRNWTDKDGQKRDEATFLNCVAYDKKAETIHKFLRKGSLVYLGGRISTRTATNDKGETRTFFDIVVNDFQFLTPKGAAAPRGQTDETGHPADTDEDDDF